MKKNTIGLLLSSLLVFTSAAAFAADQHVVITNDGNKFTIKREGYYNLSGETLKIRVYGLSAWKNFHFSFTDQDVWFQGGANPKTYTVTEISDAAEIQSMPFRYTNGTTRRYRFEVTDMDGKVLASLDRAIEYSNYYSVSSSIYDEKSVTVLSEMTKVTDAGYDSNGAKSVDVSPYIAQRNYLDMTNAELRMTLSMTVREEDDGYQYLQILADETESCDNRSGCSDGNPGNINLSRYMAGFGHDPGDKNTNPSTYTFPLTSYGSDCGEKSNPWGNTIDAKLYDQKFNEDCRASDGKLLLPRGINNLVLRFNASGKNNDNWYVNNVIAKIKAVDTTAPDNLNGARVASGPYGYGCPVTISIPFNEIVIVSGTPTLDTNWGLLTYIGGSGSNVLTFSGTISTLERLKLRINTLSGSVRDLAGNYFVIEENNIGYSDNSLVTKGGDADMFFNKLADNVYEIASLDDLKELSDFVNAENTCSGLTFRQTADIIADNELFTPIAYCPDNDFSKVFSGTYDGQNHVISGLQINKANHCVGLFGYLSDAEVKNVILRNSSISGKSYVGGIVGQTDFTAIRNCRVESSVTINNGINGYSGSYHGGIAGDLFRSASIIEGCFCAARLTNYESGGGGGEFGGIAGKNEGQIRNCIFMGNKFTVASEYGALIGYCDNSAISLISNNYYTTNDFWGVGRLEETWSNRDMDGARKGRIISAGEGVTIVPAEAATVYPASGITAYGSTSLMYDGKLYSGNTQTVLLNLSHEDRPGYVFGGYVASGGTLTESDGAYSLTMPSADVTISAVWTEAEDLSVTVRKAEMAGQTKFWTTFYHPAVSYRLPSVALAFTMKSDKVLYAVGEGDIIPAGCPVVIMADASAVTDISGETATLTLSRTEESAAAEDGNILAGTASATVASTLAPSGKKVYVLGKKDGNFGFFEFSGATVPANKAYYLE